MSQPTKRKGYYWVRTGYAARYCKICGAKFIPQGPRRLTCGEECRMENRRASDRRRYNRRRADT